MAKEYALIPIDEVLINWADEIVCMDKNQQKSLEEMAKGEKPVICLDIRDSFEYRDSNLQEAIASQYKSKLKDLESLTVDTVL